MRSPPFPAPRGAALARGPTHRRLGFVSVRTAALLLAGVLGTLGPAGVALAALDVAIGGAFSTAAEGSVRRAVRTAWADRADAARFVEPVAP